MQTRGGVTWTEPSIPKNPITNQDLDLFICQIINNMSSQRPGKCNKSTVDTKYLDLFINWNMTYQWDLV